MATHRGGCRITASTAATLPKSCSRTAVGRRQPCDRIRYCRSTNCCGRWVKPWSACCHVDFSVDIPASPAARLDHVVLIWADDDPPETGSPRTTPRRAPVGRTVRGQPPTGRRQHNLGTGCRPRVGLEAPRTCATNAPRAHTRYQAPPHRAPDTNIRAPTQSQSRLRLPRARTLHQPPRRSGEHARSRCPGPSRSRRVGPCSRETGRR
jgi:hypothetical protein